MSSYPDHRPRRLRRTPALRRAFAETSLAPSDLIAPLFVKEGLSDPVPIASMPGHAQHTLESLVKETRELVERGVSGVILFGVPSRKDPEGTESWNEDGIVQQRARATKDEVGDEAVVIADLCLCEYTDHGHCGLLDGDEVDNDPTIEAYGRIASSQAAAGADVIAPSGMMDGQVRSIRRALDDGRFRSRPDPGLRGQVRIELLRSFQRCRGRGTEVRGPPLLPAGSARTSTRLCVRSRLDIEEGADALMVKPALPYLDVVRAVKDTVPIPNRCLQRVRRVRDVDGRGRTRLDRRTAAPRSRP